MREVRSQSSETSSDLVSEQMVVVTFDAIKEITIIMLRELEISDAICITTVTDRIRASTRNRYQDVQEKVIVWIDTVYIEK